MASKTKNNQQSKQTATKPANTQPANTQPEAQTEENILDIAAIVNKSFEQSMSATQPTPQQPDINHPVVSMPPINELVAPPQPETHQQKKDIITSCKIDQATVTHEGFVISVKGLEFHGTQEVVDLIKNLFCENNAETEAEEEEVEEEDENE